MERGIEVQESTELGIHRKVPIVSNHTLNCKIISTNYLINSRVSFPGSHFLYIESELPYQERSQSSRSCKEVNKAFHPSSYIWISRIHLYML